MDFWGGEVLWEQARASLCPKHRPEGGVGGSLCSPKRPLVRPTGGASRVPPGPARTSTSEPSERLSSASVFVLRF